jgi:hypothetical protein
MRALTAANPLDLLDQLSLLRKFLEVDEALGTVLTQELLLLAASVNPNDAQTDRIGVLDREVTCQIEKVSS